MGAGVELYGVLVDLDIRVGVVAETEADAFGVGRFRVWLGLGEVGEVDF